MLSLLRPRYVMPIHGEYRMQAAHAKLAREAGVPEERILIAENGSVVELARGGARLVDRVDSGVTFVDGLRVGDVKDVALRDRRRLSEDGVLIVVTTLASSDGGEIAPPELIARGFAESEDLLDELRDEADRVVRELAAGARNGDQAPAGAHPRRGRPDRLRPHAPPAHGSPGRHRGVMAGWDSVIESNAASELERTRLVASSARARRRRSRSAACSSAGGGERRFPRRPAPGRPRCGARRIESRRRSQASSGRLSQYLLELEPELAEGRSWYAGPGRRGARGVASRARSGRAFARARTAWRRSTSSSPFSCGHSKGWRRPRASTPHPIVPRSGQASSTSGHAARLDGRRPARARRVALATSRRARRRGASARRSGSSPRPSRAGRRSTRRARAAAPSPSPAFPSPYPVGSAPSIASAWACDSASLTEMRREPARAEERRRSCRSPSRRRPPPTADRRPCSGSESAKASTFSRVPAIAATILRPDRLG